MVDGFRLWRYEMIIGAHSDGSFISFKGYSGVLLVPEFLDMATRYIYAPKKIRGLLAINVT